MFGWFDLVTASLLLPLVGLLVAAFVGWKMRAESARDELFSENRAVFWLWRWLLRYIALPGIAIVLVAGVYRSVWA